MNFKYRSNTVEWKGSNYCVSELFSIGNKGLIRPSNIKENFLKDDPFTILLYPKPDVLKI